MLTQVSSSRAEELRLIGEYVDAGLVTFFGIREGVYENPGVLYMKKESGNEESRPQNAMSIAD